MSLPRVLIAGYATVDLVFHGFDEVPPPGSTTQAEGLEISPGGHAVNVSVDMVKLGYDASSLTVYFKVGDDVFGEMVLSYLKSFGIAPAAPPVRGARTSIVAVLSPRLSDRRFVNFAGASELFTFEELSRLAAGAEALYITTGVWARIGQPIEGYHGLKVVDFSAVPPRLSHRVRDAVEWADLVHGNPSELSSAMGSASYVDAVRRLLRGGVTAVLVSKGDAGAELFVDGIAVRQRAYSVRAVDATGAGDAMVAAMLVWLMTRRLTSPRSLLRLSSDELAEALAFAQAAGASAVTDYGATAGVSRDLVERLINEQGDQVIKTTEFSKFEA